MRLTLFLAALVAAVATMSMTGCGGGAEPNQELSNENGMRGWVSLSPQADYPRICFAKKVSGEYVTDVSYVLPRSHASSDPVPFWCPWPTATEGTWWIIVYNDKNRDNLYQVNEFLGMGNICIRKDPVRGKFEIVDKNTFTCSNWDATKTIGYATNVYTSYTQ